MTTFLRLFLFVFLLLTSTALAADNSLRDAVNAGDIAKVRALLDQGADVNAKDKYGYTPLHNAADAGRKEVAELLLAKGADVNARGNSGNTPLHQAAYNGYKEVAELLLFKGADVNARADDGRTSLHYATVMGKKNVAELLLNKGADVNAKDNRGEIPLQSAVLSVSVSHSGGSVEDQKKYEEITELLLVNGANINIIKGYTNREDIVRCIEKYIIYRTDNPRGLLARVAENVRKNPNDAVPLRRLVIKLALTMKSELAVPEEAERRMARGIAAFQGAKSVADYQSAASEFEQATNAAPWYGDAYYNLGLAQDKAGNFAGALQSLEFAALASPGNLEIKNLLYQVEYRRDQSKAKTQAAERVFNRLRGDWNILQCSVSKDIDTGCTGDETGGVNWSRLYDWGKGAPKTYQFKLNPDDTVEIAISFKGIYGTTKKIVGTTPPDLGKRTVWVCHYESDTRTNEAYSEDTLYSDSPEIRFSCDFDENFSERFHYRLFKRPK